jgi:hypothetical protein
VSRYGSPVSDGLQFAGYSLPLEGSPLAAFEARVNADLAAGDIPCACPHPATADTASFPSGLYGCEDCVRTMQVALDAQHAPLCACCGEPATKTTAWLAGTVTVIARVCGTCSSTGNFVQSPN